MGRPRVRRAEGLWPARARGGEGADGDGAVDEWEEEAVARGECKRGRLRWAGEVGEECRKEGRIGARKAVAGADVKLIVDGVGLWLEKWEGELGEGEVPKIRSNYGLEASVVEEGC